MLSKLKSITISKISNEGLKTQVTKMIADLESGRTDEKVAGKNIQMILSLVEKKFPDALKATSKAKPAKEKPEPGYVGLKNKPAQKAEAKPNTEEKVVVDGITYDMMDCEQAIAALEARKEQHDKAAGKYKTKPVMHKVSDNIATAVNIAVKEMPKNKTPKQKIKQLNAVIGAVENLFEKIEDLLGKKISDPKLKESLEMLKNAVKEAKNE